MRFLSCEPLLGRVDLSKKRVRCGNCFTLADLKIGGGHPLLGPDPRQNGVQWIITGGESGPGARPMHPEWARSLRDQATEAGVAFHFKQWGEFRPRLIDIAGSPAPICRGNGWGTLDSAGSWHPTATPWNGHQDADSPSGEVVMVSVGKAAAGRLLDGRTWDGFPRA